MGRAISISFPTILQPAYYFLWYIECQGKQILLHGSILEQKSGIWGIEGEAGLNRLKCILLFTCGSCLFPIKKLKMSQQS